MDAKSYEKLGKNLRVGKQDADFLLDDALESVLNDLNKYEVVAASIPEDWVWSDNALFEGFLVSIGKKGIAFQGLAIKPLTYTEKGKIRTMDKFETPIFDEHSDSHKNYRDCRNFLVKIINTYNKRK